jgi:glycosyltransferase involved in cell wall biosynthesis
MRMVYLTAGAAGMYCGSCMHDNSLAKALIRRGNDAILVPVYTPILTDQENASQHQLFFGGLNVYLQQISPVFRWLPGWTDSFLSSPRLVGWIASRAMATSAKSLGELTVSMLQGESGKQRKEVRRLCRWLASLSPDLVIFSNLLIAGSLPTIQRELPGCKSLVILQGDDVFYNSLEEPYRTKALVELRRLAQLSDGFLVHSQDYLQRMSQLLAAPPAKFLRSPLSIDAEDLLSIPRKPSPGRDLAVGYLARLTPEKGLHLLVDAFIELNRQGPSPVRLEIAGWLGKQYDGYWRAQQEKLHQAGLDSQYHYWGAIDRKEKLRFLEAIDLLSVPTSYADPKGLFALEAMAAGVPYLLPAHGAFPELHQLAAAGRLHQPDSVPDLIAGLSEMLGHLDQTRKLGEIGRAYVRTQATGDQEASVIEGFVRI